MMPLTFFLGPPMFPMLLQWDISRDKRKWRHNPAKQVISPWFRSNFLFQNNWRTMMRMNGLILKKHRIPVKSLSILKKLTDLPVIKNQSTGYQSPPLLAVQKSFLKRSNEHHKKLEHINAKQHVYPFSTLSA